MKRPNYGFKTIIKKVQIWILNTSGNRVEVYQSCGRTFCPSMTALPATKAKQLSLLQTFLSPSGLKGGLLGNKHVHKTPTNNIHQHLSDGMFQSLVFDFYKSLLETQCKLWGRGVMCQSLHIRWDCLQSSKYAPKHTSISHNIKTNRWI